MDPATCDENEATSGSSPDEYESAYEEGFTTSEEDYESTSRSSSLDENENAYEEGFTTSEEDYESTSSEEEAASPCGSENLEQFGNAGASYESTIMKTPSRWETARRPHGGPWVDLPEIPRGVPHYPGDTPRRAERLPKIRRRLFTESPEKKMRDEMKLYQEAALELEFPARMTLEQLISRRNELVASRVLLEDLDERMPARMKKKERENPRHLIGLIDKKIERMEPLEEAFIAKNAAASLKKFMDDAYECETVKTRESIVSRIDELYGRIAEMQAEQDTWPDFVAGLVHKYLPPRGNPAALKKAMREKIEALQLKPDFLAGCPNTSDSSNASSNRSHSSRRPASQPGGSLATATQAKTYSTAEVLEMFKRFGSFVPSAYQEETATSTVEIEKRLEELDRILDEVVLYQSQLTPVMVKVLHNHLAEGSRPVEIQHALWKKIWAFKKQLKEKKEGETSACL